MRPSVTREGYALIVEQFIRAVGVLSVAQALGEEAARTERLALSRPVFQLALKEIAEILNIRRGDSNEFGVLYNVKVPPFPSPMGANEKGGFRAIYANVLAKSLGLKVTEFAPHPTDGESFALRLCEVQQQALFEQLERLNRLAERSH